ncbi:Hypothetical predicted protein [Paramuricea clavata]|uniref:Uncharacterized protein n=1 Tax=Paramuricea clavata TaxID=317549 RepID=A0A6S7GYV7_PARCT|nr:Hypothetical predicted protein [Paramuricea clavata]
MFYRLPKRLLFLEKKHSTDFGNILVYINNLHCCTIRFVQYLTKLIEFFVKAILIGLTTDLIPVELENENVNRSVLKSEVLSEHSQPQINTEKDEKDFLPPFWSVSHSKTEESGSESETEDDMLPGNQCHQCLGLFSSRSNLTKHLRLGRCKSKKRKHTMAFGENEKENSIIQPPDLFVYNQKRLLPALWDHCAVKKVKKLHYDIDGVCVYELDYDAANMMGSSKDGRPWRIWHTSRRSGYDGIRRVATCGGTYQCNNNRCPYLHSYSKTNKVQFKTVTSQVTSCACCGYEAVPVPCDAKKVWEFSNDTLLVYHCGKHSCVAKKQI